MEAGARDTSQSDRIVVAQSNRYCNHGFVVAYNSIVYQTFLVNFIGFCLFDQRLCNKNQRGSGNYASPCSGPELYDSCYSIDLSVFNFAYFRNPRTDVLDER